MWEFLFLTNWDLLFPAQALPGQKPGGRKKKNEIIQPGIAKAIAPPAVAHVFAGTERFVLKTTGSRRIGVTRVNLPKLLSGFRPPEQQAITAYFYVKR